MGDSDWVGGEQTDGWETVIGLRREQTDGWETVIGLEDEQTDDWERVIGLEVSRPTVGRQ